MDVADVVDAVDAVGGGRLCRSVGCRGGSTEDARRRLRSTYLALGAGACCLFQHLGFWESERQQRDRRELKLRGGCW